MRARFQNIRAMLSGAQWLVLFFVLVLLAGSLVKSYHYITQYGNIDLRAHVIGGRLLFSPHSPYFFIWSPGYSDRLLMFPLANNGAHIVNGVTQTPGYLYFQALFNGFNYKTIQWQWLLCQFGFMAYIYLFFVTQATDAARHKWLAFVVAAFFFSCSAIWFINVERGQSYTLFAFLLCIIYQLWRRHTPVSLFLLGALVVVATYGRPNFLVLALLPLLSFNRWAFLGLMAAAVPLGIHAWLHLDLWKEYNEAMAIYADFGTTRAAVKSAVPITYPTHIEGIDANLLGHYKKDFQVGGIFPVLSRVGQVVGPVSNAVALLVYALCAGGLFLLVRGKKGWRQNKEDLFLLGFLLFMLFEWLMPTPRAAYNLVQWIVPVLILLQKPRFGTGGVVTLIAALCFVSDIPAFLPFLNDVGEALLIFCTVYYIRRRAETPPQPNAARMGF